MSENTNKLTDRALQSGAGHRTMQDTCPVCAAVRGDLTTDHRACSDVTRGGVCPHWRDIERAEHELVALEDKKE